MTSPEAWLSRQADHRPAAIALETESCIYSFSALETLVSATARALCDAGTVPGRPLGCVTDRAETLALLALAAPRAGLPFFPVNPKMTVAQIDALFDKAGVVAVIDQTKYPADLAPVFRAGEPKAPGWTPVQLIIATSGSTGEAKGVMLTGGNLAAAVRASRTRLGVEPGDVWLGCLPLFHIGGLSVLFRCLEAGATMRLHSRFDAAAVASDLAEGRASHVSLVPAMLSQLLDLSVRPSRRLRTVLIGGAGLPAALAERAVAAGWPICPSYGMSEAGSQVATAVSADAWRPGLAGEPLPGFEIASSAAGRIRLRGPSIMAGYMNPELNPGDGLDRDGWFETNDLGGLDAAGRLRVFGRADDVLISGGENIHPIDVENLAGRCPGVSAIAVTGLPDPVWGDLLVAMVVGTVDQPDFLDWCRAHLPAHLRPRKMMVLDTLPLTDNGKLDRRALRQLAADILRRSSNHQI